MTTKTITRIEVETQVKDEGATIRHFTKQGWKLTETPKTKFEWNPAYTKSQWDHMDLTLVFEKEVK